MNVGELVTPTGVLVMTAHDMQADRDRWLQMRRGHDDVPGFYCLGSSDMAAILKVAFGADKAALPIRLWLDKVKHVEQPDSAVLMWGRLHEDTISQYWMMRNRSVIHPVGLICNTDKPWHQTSLDRVVDECPLDRRVKSRCALEIKTRNAFGSRRWHAELPDDVLAQIVHQLFVTGFEHIHFAVLIGGNEYRQGVVRAETEVDTIAYVIGLADHFRDTYLQPGNEIEPPWDLDLAPQSIIDLDAAKYPERVGEIDVPDIGDVVALSDVRARKNALAREEKRLKALLLRHAQGARHVLFASELAYEMVPRSKTHINVDTLAEKYPNVWNDPEVVEFRTFYQLDLAPAYKTRTGEDTP